MTKNYVGLKAVGMGFASAHLTVICTGDLEAATEVSVQRALDNLGNPTFYVERREIAMFGPMQDIPVVLIKPTMSLWGLRKALENDINIPNPSEYDWNPHITLEFEPGSILRIPPVIVLHKLGLY